ncbi:MAG: ABC transporter ATP-binding protein [Pirellulaceae bacterium]|nr:ABC transporter ATP-binding protein [Pirellulaceae bacterium]
MSLRYRFTVVGTIVCALAVGVLWGGNIGAVFPFVEVVFRGQSLQEWVDGEVEKAEQKIERMDAQIAGVAGEPELDSNQRKRLVARRRAEVAALEAYRRAQPYIYRYLPEQPFTTLLLVMMLLFIGTLIKDVFLASSTVLTERLAQAGTIQLRKQLFNQTLRTELQSFQNRDSSQLLSRLTYDLEQVTIGLRMLFGRSIREPLKMLACLIGAAFICWRLLLLSMFLAPLAALLISLLNRALKRANARALDEMSQIYSVLGETLRGMKIVKAYTMERIERRRFDVVSRRFFQRAMRVAIFDAMVRPTIEMMGIGIICVAILGGAYLVLNQETHLLGLKISERPLSISAVMLFFGLLTGVSDPARKLSGVIGKLQRAAAAADRVFELIDRSSELPRASRPVDTVKHQRELRFENVKFAYRDGPLVLDEVSLRVQAGETIAFVGPNGCGKSTLANLVLRFFDPDSGAVSIDGVDLRQMRLRDLRSQVGLVTQEAVLFNDTVEANIRLGHPNASREQVVRAAQQAHAHDFIENQLADGYQTVVGEGASRLSGGQKQRISLARAILRDPKILILDEATSQVDVDSERQIHAALAAFMQGRTSLIITHRTGILELADRIIVMEGGRITDDGTLPELMARSSAFHRLSTDHRAKSA